MAVGGSVTIDQEICKSCGLCLEHCPKGALHVSDTLNEKGYYPVQFTEGECTGCALCAVVCPEAGIEVWRG